MGEDAAVGPDVAARVQAMAGAAMARPPGRRNRSQPSPGVGHNSGERPDPEPDNDPPPTIPAVLPSSGQGSEGTSEADRDYARVARRYKLEASSETSLQLLEILDIPVEALIGRYRQGGIPREFPTDLRLDATVRQVLESGNAKAIGLLRDGRFAR